VTAHRDVHKRPVTPEGDPIMGAKFRIAAIKSPVLTRWRLLDRLSDGTQGPLTLISAPAGSGKTMLASSWTSAGAGPGPVTWITLDADDDRSGVFWSYVIAGLARGGVPTSEVGMPDHVDAVEHSLLVRLAACLSEQPQPQVLVLDHAEGLTRPGLAEEIDFMLRHSAGQLRLVLITRVDPHLPLHQYRLEGAVTEIRFPELAFTLDEARGLLQGQDVHLSESALAAFVHRTRGWAAGLRLAGPAGGDATGDEASDPSGVAGGDMAAYFRAEVLEAQPPEVRDFLLATSVVDRLLPGLATHLTGARGAAGTLRLLAETGGLLERSPDDHDECYEYHPLVRDLLRAQLHLESPARQRRLRRKAARWLADAGRTGEAIRQHAAARDWDDAAALLVRDLTVTRLLTDPPSTGIADVFAAMPAGTPGPEAATVAATLALLRHNLDSCEKHLGRANELVAAGASGQARALRLATAAIGCALAAANGDAAGTFSAASTAQEALSSMAADGMTAPPETRALVLWCTGRSHLGAGDLGAARETLASAARAANVPGCEYLRARCLAHLALADALTGRLRRAAEFANRAMALCERRGVAAGPRPPAAEVALAWVSAEQSDVHQGSVHADAAAATAEIRHDPVCLGALALVRSRLLRARGDLAGAVEAVSLARAAGETRPLPRWLANRLGAAEAVLLLAQGKRDAALALVPRPPSVHEPESMLASGWTLLPAGGAAEAGRIARQVLQRAGLPLDVRVDALLLTAACDLNTARPEAAKAVMDQAFQLAEPERMHRPFEEAPTPLRSFMRGQRELAGSRRRWAGESRAQARTGGSTGGEVIVQPLTEREQEVLTYLAMLLPTEEIARRMFVSVNTVKTHVRSILRKLSADRRNEAVRRARELGLVS